jgi:arsenite-transporting ATPase
LYGDDDPLAVPPVREPLRITRTSHGAVLHLRLPHVSRADVELARDGDDLVVTVASYRRLLTLPSGLARHRVVGARVDAGELQVRFAVETGEE